MIDKKEIRKIAEECLSEIDNTLFIVDLTVSSSNVISLEIDKEESSVSIDECVKVSRAIEKNLDRDQADFELSVSSAGLSQPLRDERQFKKNVGKEITVKLNDGKKIEGKLIDSNDKNLQMSYEISEKVEGKKKKIKKEIIETVEKSMIKEVKVVIQFK